MRRPSDGLRACSVYGSTAQPAFTDPILQSLRFLAGDDASLRPPRMRAGWRGQLGLRRASRRHCPNGSPRGSRCGVSKCLRIRPLARELHLIGVFTPMRGTEMFLQVALWAGSMDDDRECTGKNY